MKTSLPIRITSPIRLHIVLLVIGAIGFSLGIVNVYENGFNETKDYAMMGLFISMIGWFGYRVLSPKTKIIFSSSGIWTDVHGQKSWSDFAGVAIEKRQVGRYQKELLLLLFDIAEEPHELQYDFYDLNLSVRQFKALLDGPLQPYMEL